MTEMPRCSLRKYRKISLFKQSRQEGGRVRAHGTNDHSIMSLLVVVATLCRFWPLTKKTAEHLSGAVLQPLSHGRWRSSQTNKTSRFTAAGRSSS